MTGPQPVAGSVHEGSDYQCAEPDCDRPRWTTKRRAASTVVSDFCFEHRHVAMFDVPAKPESKLKPKPPKRLRSDDKGKPLLSHFHSEVRRQRLERER
jgi:hypothetical protein